VSIRSFYLFGSHQDHVFETHPGMRHLDFGEDHEPHPRVVFAEDLTSMLERDLPHQGDGKGLKLVGEVPAADLPWLVHLVHLRGIAPAPSSQCVDLDPLIFRDFPLAPLHRLHMIAAGHHGSFSNTFLRPQFLHFLHLEGNFEDSASYRAYTTLKLFPIPSYCSKVCSGVINRHHPVGVKPRGHTQS
jgi:hypothetical protein